ncbi:MAG: hypothetical protein K0U79_02315 [Gammaproteobacteria bacterium]|nr:hypothetical protein [Gammaproteobacteria bacterium]
MQSISRRDDVANTLGRCRQAGVSRRSVLIGGGMGVALFAAGGWVATRLTDGTAQPLFDGKRLDAAQQQMLARVADAVFETLLPTDAARRGETLHWIVENVDQAIDGMPQALREETLQLLAMLGAAPTRWLLIGQWQSWSAVERAALQSRLLALRGSGYALKRTVFIALHDLVCTGYYGDRRSWAAIGYPGPVIDRVDNG